MIVSNFSRLFKISITEKRRVKKRIEKMFALMMSITIIAVNNKFKFEMPAVLFNKVYG